MVASEEKYNLFHGIEDKAAKLMFKNRLTSEEVSQILKREDGVNLAPMQLAFIKKKKKEWLCSHSEEIEADFLLDSIDKNIMKFENLFERFEGLADKWKEQGDDFKQMMALREMKDMLRMSIKRLEEYKKQIEAQPRVSITSNTQVMNFIRTSRHKMFSEMVPELTSENKLILHKPSPEIIDEFYSWKAKSKPKPVVE